MAHRDNFFQTQSTWAANFAVVQRPINQDDKNEKKRKFRDVI
jgi:hypothetical protein